MTTPIRYPTGPVWPETMRADMAAAFCDEPSVEAFRSKVGDIYPQPVKRKRCPERWHIEDLREAVARLHGRQVAGSSEDLAALV